MARVVVDVMPKPEVADPQGRAVHAALGKLGVDAVSGVRQGKRIELHVASTDEATLERIDCLAQQLLANPATEDYVLKVEDR